MIEHSPDFYCPACDVFDHSPHGAACRGTRPGAVARLATKARAAGSTQLVAQALEVPAWRGNRRMRRAAKKLAK